MVVHPSFPAKTVREFIAYAKANPGKVNMGSAGNGSATHVFGELFKAMAGVDLHHSGNLAAVVAGQSHVMFELIPSSIDFIRAGKLRSLAAMTATRLELLPDLPTVSEFVPGYEASSFAGIGAPKSTPTEIIDRLNKEIGAGLADPRLKARLADLGGTILALSPPDFGRLIADETDKWGRVIRTANIKLN
jgi:tripartite-type tricarboxylate transporter receptor subunit TctC